MSSVVVTGSVQFKRERSVMPSPWASLASERQFEKLSSTWYSSRVELCVGLVVLVVRASHLNTSKALFSKCCVIVVILA